MPKTTFHIDDLFSSARSVVSSTLLEIGKICPEAVVMTADLVEPIRWSIFRGHIPIAFLT